MCWLGIWWRAGWEGELTDFLAAFLWGFFGGVGFGWKKGKWS